VKLTPSNKTRAPNEYDRPRADSRMDTARILAGNRAGAGSDGG
jgi:hypothetical protein